MSIESALAELTAAVKENTAALKGAKATTGAASSGSTGKPAAKTASYKAKHTVEEAHALMARVREDHGIPAAKEIVSSLGYSLMKDITKPEDIDKLFDAAEAKLNEEGGGGGQEEEI